MSTNMGYVLTDKEYLDLLDSSKDIPKLKRILAKDCEEINKQLCGVRKESESSRLDYYDVCINRGRIFPTI